MRNGKMDIQNTQLSENYRGEISKLKESLKESFEDNGHYGVVAFSLIVSDELNALMSGMIEPSVAYAPVKISSLNKS